MDYFSKKTLSTEPQVSRNYLYCLDNTASKALNSLLGDIPDAYCYKKTF